MAYGDSAIWTATEQVKPSNKKITITWTTTFASRVSSRCKKSSSVTFHFKTRADLSVIASKLAHEWDKTNPNCHRARANGNKVRFKGNVVGMYCVVKGSTRKYIIRAFKPEKIGDTGLTVWNSV